MKNKILIDLERLRYPNTGLANVFRNLAKGMKSENSNFDISYFGPKQEVQKINSSLNLIEYKFWHKYYERFSQKFDIVHCSHQLSHFFHKKYNHTIKILTLHDLNFLHENLSNFKREKLLRKVNENLENTDYLVCISHFVKEDVLKNKDILKLQNIKEILVIHNGINLPQEKEYDLGRFSYLKNKKYILNIGVLFEKKNQKSLVEMLPYLEQDLVLVSSGQKEPYATELRNKIQELKLTNRVHFLSHISEEEKYALIQHCQAYCHPSLAEGFGIPPIEAMAFGKLTFLSTYTSLPEIGGEYAFYFQDFVPQNMANTFKSGMKKYNENLCEYQDQLKKWASQFNYCRMADDYLSVYQKILNKN